MLKNIIFITLIALITLCTILILNPARANPYNTANEAIAYHWEYPWVGTSQRVCKKIIFHPTQKHLDEQREQVKVKSFIVSDRYCQ